MWAKQTINEGDEGKVRPAAGRSSSTELKGAVERGCGMVVNNDRKISEGRLMKRGRKREDGDGKHKDTGGKEERAGRDGAEPSAGHGRERVAC